MKILIIFLITLAVAPSFAQMTVSQKYDSSTTERRDTAFRVINMNNTKKPVPVAFFLNGKFIGSHYFIKPDLIENINIVKRDTLIGAKNYMAQIYVKVKSDYTPRLISLADIKAKYTDFKQTPVVFMLDADVINSEPDSYFVDENMLLSVVVDNLDTIEIGVIKLITRTEENIKKRNNIILRGKELADNKETAALSNDRTSKIL
ncbi:hypothetical protein [Sphingobacterium paucimobilis]|uniref:Uncharacterized protein n=1 Tax=Sphingobacterium paucimobilis HER1398 TaxID=1346330 RepID=U2HQ28_9SPHI|nr:hypothetical protein [Sphingobacterium paucimobilis]ERJ57400.1 hypothetical protein M472_01335 [Sphingobacterium paucimobilis HER1398]